MATSAISLSPSPFPLHSPKHLPIHLPTNSNLRLRSPSIKASAAAATTAAPMSTISTSGVVLVDKSDVDKTHRLKTSYREKIVPILIDEFNYENIHEVPKIQKITVNCGMGDAEQNNKGLEAVMKDLSMITGQRPVKTKAKKSIAIFKLREGATVGMAVTLRRDLMYSFLDRLINLALPRSSDFQGVNPNSFDGHGNYALGLSQQSVFPEIRYEGAGKQRGMDVCITTTAKTDKEAQRLLALMGMPFREGGEGPVLSRKKRRGDKRSKYRNEK